MVEFVSNTFEFTSFRAIICSSKYECKHKYMYKLTTNMVKTIDDKHHIFRVDLVYHSLMPQLIIKYS